MSSVRLLIALLLVGYSSRAWSQTIPDLPDRWRGDVAGSRPQPAFDPVGVRLGSFLARADGDIDIGYNSNLYGRTSNVVGDGFVKVRPSVRLASDWGRHSAEIDARAEVTRFASETSQNTNEFWTRAGGAVELGDSITLRPNIHFSRAAEGRGSVTNNLTAGTPLYNRTFGVDLGATYGAGPFRAELLVAHRRERFEDVEIAGVEIPQRGRDTNAIGGRGALLYRITPTISAMIQGVVDKTQNPHDDLSDLRRAHGYAVLAGIRIDPSGMIAGQIAIGFRRRFFDGSNTSSRGFTYDARLQWYPTELLTVSLKADQQFSNSGILAANAVLVDRQTLGLAYEMYRDLNFTLEANREHARYRDVDTTTNLLGIGVRAIYTSSPLLQLSAFARYENRHTDRPELAARFNALRVGASARVRL